MSTTSVVTLARSAAAALARLGETEAMAAASIGFAALAARLSGATSVALQTSGAARSAYRWNLRPGTRLQDLLAGPDGSSGPADLVLDVAVTETVAADRDVVRLAVTALSETAVPLRFDDTVLDRFVANAVARPEEPLANLDLLSVSEQERLRDWNRTETAPIRYSSVDMLVADGAQHGVDRLAIVDDTRSLTHRELEHRVHLLAHAWRAAGIETGDRVAIALPRGVDLAVALLATWRAGAVCVPVDPDEPPGRLRRLLATANITTMVTDRPRAPFAGLRHVSCDLDTDAGSGHARIAVGRPDEPETARSRPAYVMFTSGSTGTPKAVVVSHGNLLNLLAHLPSAIGLTRDDVLLAVSPPTFDISLLELLGPLTVGAQVVVAATEDTRDGARLVARLRDSHATVLQATPSTWSLVLGCGETLPPITALCGGEPLTPALATRLAERTTAAWNLYGPTETTVWSTAAPVRLCQAGEPTVGRPIANTQVHILDAGEQPVPPGQPGEVWISGAGVALGYADDPGLTTMRFRADPSVVGGRRYRTGDLGIYREDGNLVLLGRLDDMVKVAGHRIEPGEVEAALTAVPGVRDAAVVATERPNGARTLAAFVVAPSTTVDAIRSHLRLRLPTHLVPARITAVDRLPLLPNGKVDRQALRSRSQAGGEHLAGLSPTEKAVVRLWIDVLGTPPDSAEDDFFTVGGDSLAAGTLVNRIERLTGAVLLVAAIYAHPTVRTLAAYLTAERPEIVEALAGVKPSASTSRTSDTRPAVDDDLYLAFRDLVTGPAPMLPSTPIDAPVGFILSAPRSGSTLLRVMLAGHPALFVPPELELLSFDTFDARQSVLRGRLRSTGDGLVRALVDRMTLDGDSHAGVKRRYAGMPIAEVYADLAALAKPATLVDKTTTYAMDQSTLVRAAALFAEPRYVHLVRNPAAVIASYEQSGLDLVFRHRHDLTSRQLAELIWLASNDNLNRLPGKVLRVRFEDLVADPRRVLRAVTEHLGVAFDEAVLHPYADTRGRMIDGLHDVSRMAGDFKFRSYQRIEPAVAHAWKGRINPHSLSARTREMAAQYGYEDSLEEA